jgi:hypothetical protein
MSCCPTAGPLPVIRGRSLGVTVPSSAAGVHVMDTTNVTHWYSANPAYSPNLRGQGYTDTYVYPDILLTGSLDDSTFGPPGLGVQSSCWTSGSDADLYQYSRILGYFPSPTKSNALGGVAAGEAIRSIYYDSHGDRSFRPRFARNSQGFVPLSSSTPTSRTWSTFALYNPIQITQNSSDGCSNYTRWNTSDQQFAFSLVTITEQ